MIIERIRILESRKRGRKGTVPGHHETKLRLFSNGTDKMKVCIPDRFKSLDALQ